MTDDAVSGTDRQHAVDDEGATTVAPEQVDLHKAAGKLDTPATAAANVPTKAKMSKADRLAARAEKLRARDDARAAQRAAQDESGPARRPTGWIIATCVVSVLAVALATVLVIGFVSWHHQRQVDDARSAALKAAESYAVAFGTYDYQHLDADFAKTSQLLTPSFAKRYKSTSSALAKTFAAYKTKVTASVPSGGAAVISASTSKAQVLVLLDQVITNSQSKTPTINRNRLKVSLVHSHGKWLVDRTDAT